MPLQTLQDLLVEELRDLYHAEKQLVKALPRVARTARDPRLKSALEAHLAETEGHVERLLCAFAAMGQKPLGKRCRGMEGLVEEGKEMLSSPGMDAVRDAGIIGTAQRIEHYEIAGYGTAINFAELLHLEQVAGLLRETLEEEKGADRALSSIAEEYINPAAVALGQQDAAD